MVASHPAVPAASFDAVLVGGGPRAVAALNRVAARLGASAQQTARPLHVAVIDALEVGPGATWLTSQPAAYLNNTTASATTIHPDASTVLSGPTSPGPSLVDWMEGVARSGSHPAGDWVVAEARALRALDFTSRRLQGVYYRDQLEAAAAHPGLELTEITATVVDLEQPGPDAPGRSGSDVLAPRGPGPAVHAPVGAPSPSGTTVVLADGRRLSAPTVVLAQGMVQSVPDAEVAGLIDFSAEHGLRYVRPGMPAERDFSGLPAGETVLVRGLGANFFDVIGGLMTEWGGTFEEVPGDVHGRLRYLPSGREPRIVAGSRRGLPYRSKPVPYAPQRDFRPRWARPEWFSTLSESRGLDFAAEVWPSIAKDIADQYLQALADWAPEALRTDLRPAARGAEADRSTSGSGAQEASGTEETQQSTDPHVPWGADRNPGWVAELEDCATAEDVDAVLRSAVVDPRWSWCLADLHRPTRGEAISPEHWAQHVQWLVDDELASMTEPARHPRAAVNRVMSLLRGSAQRLGAVGAVSGVSLVRDLHGWFDSNGLFLASGPPSVRVRRVLALIEAGVIDLLGPETRIETELGPQPCFRAASAITGRTAESGILLETRMSKGRVGTTDDPLLRSLLSSGRARIHEVDGVRTDYLEATGAEVDEEVLTGHNLVAADGGVDESVIVLGIPASTTQPGSAIGATPGLSSPLLAGADVAAKQIIARSEAATGALLAGAGADGGE